MYTQRERIYCYSNYQNTDERVKIAQPSDLHIILPVFCTSASENKLLYVNHSLFYYHTYVMTTTANTHTILKGKMYKHTEFMQPNDIINQNMTDLQNYAERYFHG
jgi:hypothetical protein